MVEARHRLAVFATVFYGLVLLPLCSLATDPKSSEEGKKSSQESKAKTESGKKVKAPTGSARDVLGIKQSDPGKDESDSDDDPGGWANDDPPAVASPRRPAPKVHNRRNKLNPSKRGSGVAKGSVPLIKDDKSSVNFILNRLITGAQEAAAHNGQASPSTEELESVYGAYARRLAKTLSKLSPEQQQAIFYGP